MSMDFYKCVANSRYVSIYSTGVMQLSARTVQDFQLTSWEQVILGYDSESQKVAIKKCLKNEYGGLSLTHQRLDKKGSSAISARRFFNHFNLTVADYTGKRYECYNEGEMIIFSLKENLKRSNPQ